MPLLQKAAAMSRPIRLRLSRAKGFDLQEASRAANGLDAVSVARPGPHGNPFVVEFVKGMDSQGWRVVHKDTRLQPRGYSFGLYSREHALQQAAAAFRDWTSGCLPLPQFKSTIPLEPSRAEFIRSTEPLRGKNLACWCALDAPCHADVLLELANRPESEARA
jgi:hypothetical protein